MNRQPLRGSQLRSGGYDAREQTLELEFADRSVRRFTGVPDEVWRRLLAAPNAGSYFEDRIAEEYPSRPASVGQSGDDPQARLDAMFGAAAASNESAAPEPKLRAADLFGPAKGSPNE